MDYQNNRPYIFKEEGKHSLGTIALSAFYTRCLLFNGPSYLGNENEIRSRPHFPKEQIYISHGANEYSTILSHHRLKIKKKNLSSKEMFIKGIKKSCLVNARI